jgi:hypothetical protein
VGKAPHWRNTRARQARRGSTLSGCISNTTKTMAIRVESGGVFSRWSHLMTSESLKKGTTSDYSRRSISRPLRNTVGRRTILVSHTSRLAHLRTEMNLATLPERSDAFLTELSKMRVKETQEWSPHFGSYAILVQQTTALWRVRTLRLAFHLPANDLSRPHQRVVIRRAEEVPSVSIATNTSGTILQEWRLSSIHHKGPRGSEGSREQSANGSEAPEGMPD